MDTRTDTTHEHLWNLGFDTIKELETDLGILASGKEEIYGCIFGRDSLITSLKLLRVYENTHDEYFAKLVRKILATLSDLQGKNINIESGEEPGKCIHEYRPNNHEHLTKRLEKPWFVYGDNIMRNYDSVDSTPLFLIACYRYFQLTNDQSFIDEYEKNIQQALTDIQTNAEKINNMQSQIETATSAEQIASSRYLNGIGLNTDITNAAVNLQRILLTRLQYEYQLCLAKIEYARLTGYRYW